MASSNENDTYPPIKISEIAEESTFGQVNINVNSSKSPQGEDAASQ